MSAARDFIRERPFTTVLGVWGGILAGTGLYLYKRRIPTQLKIIQARILAQAGLLSGAVALGLTHFLTDDQQSKPATTSWKLRNFDQPSPPARTVVDSDATVPAEQLK